MWAVGAGPVGGFLGGLWCGCLLSRCGGHEQNTNVAADNRWAPLPPLHTGPRCLFWNPGHHPVVQICSAEFGHPMYEAGACPPACEPPISRRPAASDKENIPNKDHVDAGKVGTKRRRPSETAMQAPPAKRSLLTKRSTSASLAGKLLATRSTSASSASKTNV